MSTPDSFHWMLRPIAAQFQANEEKNYGTGRDDFLVVPWNSDIYLLVTHRT